MHTRRGQVKMTQSWATCPQAKKPPASKAHLQSPREGQGPGTPLDQERHPCCLSPAWCRVMQPWTHCTRQAGAQCSHPSTERLHEVQRGCSGPVDMQGRTWTPSLGSWEHSARGGGVSAWFDAFPGCVTHGPALVYQRPLTPPEVRLQPPFMCSTAKHRPIPCPMITTFVE